MTTKLTLSKIRLDGGTQPRAEIDPFVVDDYAAAMNEAAGFPAIVVFYDGKDHWLADGFHRVQAAMKAGLKTLASDVRQGTRRDAVLHSVGANASHGLRRTNADKRRAVETLLRDETWTTWSDNKIAQLCFVHHDTVGKARKELSLANSASETRTYTTKHGTQATMKTSNIGAKKRVYETAPAPIKEAVADGSISIERAVEVVDALEVVKETNPKFYEETIERGYVVNLDGEDVALADADSTLLRVMSNEDDYERAQRHEAHKHKPKVNRGEADEYVPQGFDSCQTPPVALDPLLPYLNVDWTIWECAAGERFLVNALHDSGFQSLTASDMLTGENFFDYTPAQWDCIVTNPPYTLKYRWLERCYQLGKPFALLLPVETLGAKTAQEFFRNCGLEVIFLDKRINFKMPNKGWEGSSAQFPVAWFTYGLNIGQQMTFARVNNETE